MRNPNKLNHLLNHSVTKTVMISNDPIQGSQSIFYKGEVVSEKNEIMILVGKNILRVLLSFVTLFLFTVDGFSQLDTKHWIPPVYAAGHWVAPQHQMVYISTPSAANVNYTITDGAGNVLQTGTVSNATPATYLMNGRPTDFIVNATEVNQVLAGRGLHIVADEKVYVNIRAKTSNNANATSLTCKGRAALGQVFRIGHHINPQNVNGAGSIANKSSTIGVMATEDGTTVSIDLTGLNLKLEDAPTYTDINGVITKTLNAGESWVLGIKNGRATGRNPGRGFIGALVTSDKDVVVNCGSWGANRVNYTAGNFGVVDICMDQIVPFSRVGTEYAIVRGFGNNTHERVLVVAHEDNTEIYLNGGAVPVATINAGDYHEFGGGSYSARGMYVTTSNPVFVYQMMMGSGNAQIKTQGMNFIPPISCRTSRFVDNIPDIDKINTNDYGGGALSIVTIKGSTVNVTDGGGAIALGAVKPIAGSIYEFYEIANLQGHVAVNSNTLALVAFSGKNGNAGYGGYFSGWDEVEVESASNCAPELLYAVTNHYNSYQWYLDGLLLPSETNDTIFSTVPGEYTFVYQLGFGADVCEDTSDYIVVAPSPSLVMNNSAICAPQTQDLTELIAASSTNLGVNTFYTDVAATAVYTDSLNAVGATYYVVSVDTSGCSDTTSVTVTVNPKPVLVIVDPAAVCSSSTVDITVGGVTTGTTNEGTNTYYTDATALATYTTPATADSAQYFIVTTTANSCTDTAAVNAVVNPQPTITLSTTPDICFGTTTAVFPYSATTNTPNEYSIDWDGTAETAGLVDVAQTTLTTTSISMSLVATVPDGTYNGTITVINTTTGCESTQAISLTIDPLPTVSVNSETICADDAAATFTATSGTATSWLWSEEGTGTNQTTTGTDAGNYTVVVTDGNSCTNTVTGTLTVNARPTVTVNSETICADDAAATFTATSGTGTSWLWSEEGTGTNQTTTGTDAGNYTVVVTDANSCSSLAATGVLIVNARPTVIVNNESICAGDGAETFTATSATATAWAWSNNGSGSNVTTSGTIAGNYTVVVTDIHSCSSLPTSGVLTVNDLPTVTVNSETICVGDAAETFTATSGTATSWLWSDNGSGTNQTTSGTTAGNYTVVVTDGNSCSSLPISGVLTVNARPTVTVNSEAICMDDAAATFTATSGTATSYLWSGNGSGINQTTSGTTAGSYTVVVTDVNSCSSLPVSGVLTVHALPTVAVNSETICTGDVASTFTATSATATGWAWSGNGSGTNVSTSGTTAGNYTVVVTDVNSCSSSAVSGVLTVNAIPTVTVNSESICAGDAAAVFTATSGTATSWLWSDNGSGTSQTTSGTTAGNYTVVVTDVNTCSSLPASGLLIVNAKPNLNITNPLTQCEPVTFDLTDGTITIGTTGLGTNQYYDGVDLLTPTEALSVDAGTYSIVTTSGDGCIDTATVTTTSELTPVLQITDPAPFCLSSTVDITASTVTSGSQNTGAIWSYWTDATALTTLTSPNNIGTANTYYIVNENGNCSDTAAVVVNTNPIPTFTVVGSTPTACGLSDGSITIAGLTPSTTYDVTYNAGAATTMATDINGEILLSTLGAGGYTNFIITELVNGCEGLDIGVTLSDPSAPTVDAGTPDNIVICEGESVTLTASNPDGAVLSWDNGIINGISFIPPVGATSYTVTASAGGCTATDNVTVTVNQKPVLTINNPAIVCNPNTVDITTPAITLGSTNQGVNTYFTDAARLNTLVDPTSVVAGTYYILTTSVDGCVDNKPVVVTASPKPVLVITDPSAVCSPSTVDITLSEVTDGSTNEGVNTYYSNAGATVSEGSPSSVETGTYYIVTRTGDGCRDTSAVVVVVNPLPTFGIVKVDPTACGVNDGSLTISGLLFSSPYDVSYDGFTTSSFTADLSGEILFDNLGAGNYSNFVITTDPEGCSSTDPGVSLSDPSAPTVDAGNPQTVCFGEEITLSATNPDGSTISWDNSVIDGVAFTPPVGTTSYRVEGDLSGCIATDDILITVHAKPVLVITDPSAVCSPNMVDITLLGVTNGSTDIGVNAYYSNAGLSTLQANPNAVSDGTYYIITTTAEECKDTAEVVVVVDLLPVFSLVEADPSSCGLSDGSITVLGLVVGSSYEMSYDGFSNTSFVANVSGEILLDNLAGGSYSNFVITKQPEGCQSTDPGVRLADPVVPTVDAGNSQTVCFGAEVILNATNPNGSIIVWDNGVNDGVAFTPRAIGTTTYTVTAGSLGCQSVDIVDVTVIQIPEIDDLIDAEVCDTYTLPIITGSNLTGAQAYYSLLGGNGDKYEAGDIILSSIELFIYDKTGVSITCPSQQSFNILVIKAPIITDVADVSVCDEYILPVITGINLSGNESYYTSSTGQGSNFSAGDLITEINQLYIYDAAGTNNMCSDEQQIMITTTPLIVPKVVIKYIDGSAHKCENEQFEFEVLSDNIRDLGYSSTYQWFVNGNSISNETEVTYITSLGDTPSDKDVFNLIMTPESSLCLSKSTATSNPLTVTVDESPILGTVSPGDPKVCFGEEVEIALVGSKGEVTWSVTEDYITWKTLEETGTTINVVTSSYLEITSFTTPLNMYYQIEVDMNNLCTSVSTTYTITEYPELKGSTDVSQECEEFIVEISANDKTQHTNFVQWYTSTDGENYSVSKEEQTIVQIDTAIHKGWYVAEFSNEIGCYQYDSLTVEDCDYPEVNIPNALTVNEDGANETFYIDRIWFYPKNKLTIYNRWGSVVYVSNGYNNDWDGSRNGSPMPVGTYYYILNLGDDAGSEFQGYITLLRP